MITIKAKGNFEKTTEYFRKLSNAAKMKKLEQYGQKGVEILRSATPVDTGITADSWGYVVERNGDRASITWTNSNVNVGTNIAVIIQYGHGTGTGGYVSGTDYVNPGMKALLDEIQNDLGKEVKS